MPETLGIGVDLCAVSRIERAIQKAHFLNRVFTEAERAYLQGRGRGAGESAAAMFAGFAQGIMPEQIEVTHADSGQPGARLTGAAQARLEQMGGGRILLSLSHEGDTAIAFALIQ